MTAVILISYICAGLFGALSFFLAAGLYRLQRSRLALSLLYFLTAYFTLGFLNLIGRHQALTLSRSQGQETLMIVNYLFAFLTFPILVCSVYLFIQLMSGILGQRLSKLFKVCYISLWSIFFLGLVFGVKQVFEGQNDSFIRELLPAGNIIAIVLYLGANLYLLTGIRAIEDKRKKKTVFLLGIIFLLTQVVVYAATSALAAPLLGKQLPQVTILLYFSFNLPALFYLRARSSDFTPADIPASPDDRTLLLFFEKHGISRREADIIKLLLKGKTNREIEKELFISLSTVKNHIYNIYRKLKVKNRIQISLMIQKFPRDGRY
jgi:DNA-binding CsgD family transcriptional regulator